MGPLNNSNSFLNPKNILIGILILVVCFLVIQTCSRKNKIDNIPVTNLHTENEALKVKNEYIEKERKEYEVYSDSLEAVAKEKDKTIAMLDKEIARLKKIKHETIRLATRLSNIGVDSAISKFGIKGYKLDYKAN